MVRRTSATARNGIWSVVESAAPLAASAIFLAILARMVPVNEFGVYAYATTLAGIGLTIITAGLNGLAVRELVNHPEHQGQIVSDLLLIRCCFAVLATAGIIATAYLSGGTSGTIAAGFASGAVLARAGDAPTYWFQATLKTRTTARIRTVLALSLLIVRCAIAVVFADIWLILSIFVLEAILSSAAILGAYLRNESSPRLVRPSIGRSLTLLKTSWPLIASSVADQVNSRADVLIIQAFQGPFQVGLYSAATKLGEFAYFLPRSYAAGTFRALLDTRREHGAESHQYRSMLQRSLDLTFWSGLALAAPLSALSWFLMPAFFGSDFSIASAVMSVYSFTLPFVFMAAAASKWIIAEGKLLASLWRHGTAAILAVALNLALVPSHGIIAAAWVSVLTSAYSSWLSFLLTRSTARYGLQMTLAIVWPLRGAIRMVGRQVRHSSRRNLWEQNRDDH